MPHRPLLVAAALLALSSPARAADTFTMNVASDPFANVRLMVKVTAPNRAGYLQEGSQYKATGEWQPVDSILCDQTTREIEVWGDPAATPRGGRMTVEFQLLVNGQPGAQATIERELVPGKARGFAHLADRDFTLLINRTCR